MSDYTAARVQIPQPCPRCTRPLVALCAIDPFRMSLIECPTCTWTLDLNTFAAQAFEALEGLGHNPRNRS